MTPNDSIRLREKLLAGELKCSFALISEHFPGFPKINVAHTFNVKFETIIHFLLVERSNKWLDDYQNEQSTDPTRALAKKNLCRIENHLSKGIPFSVLINPRFSVRSEWLTWKRKGHNDVEWHSKC